MTFDQLVSEVQDKLNLTSATSTTRIGKSINERYKRITSSIGLETTRRFVTSQTATVGSSMLTFPGIEKILTVFEKVTSKNLDTILQQITVDEMHITPVRKQPPRNFAIQHVHPNSIDIIMDCVPKTVFTLYAEGQVSLATLSTTMQPDFPESFHDALVFAGMADEYRKMEKLALMQDAEVNYEKRLSDLRMWIAKSAYLDITQGRYTGKAFRWNRNSQLV